MTAEELMEQLKTAIGKVVVIDDADTGWLLNIINVEPKEKVVILNGRYSDEYEGEI